MELPQRIIESAGQRFAELAPKDATFFTQPLEGSFTNPNLRLRVGWWYRAPDGARFDNSVILDPIMTEEKFEATMIGLAEKLGRQCALAADAHSNGLV